MTTPGVDQAVLQWGPHKFGKYVLGGLRGKNTAARTSNVSSDFHATKLLQDVTDVVATQKSSSTPPEEARLDNSTAASVHVEIHTAYDAAIAEKSGGQLCNTVRYVTDRKTPNMLDFQHKHTWLSK